MKRIIRFTFIMLGIVALIAFLVIRPIYGTITFVVAIFFLGLYDLTQKKHTILRNYPVLGHMRYLLEMIGPEIHQYFVESDTDGKPINRNFRAYIYERAKKDNETSPFGTKLNVEENEFVSMSHSIYCAEKLAEPPRIMVGGPDCRQPYSASIFNISAMSFGALSKNAIMALNLGAKAGNFFHDTGEGGLSPYHRQGGDLVYQLGTGYFGSRTREGEFSPEEFTQKAGYPEVKMVEIKISQGAKPGHGGVLPAAKNNEEIALIRGVTPHTDVLSPPSHRAFGDATGLLSFIEQLRQLSGGKPIGFKICIGKKEEFEEICRQMVATGIKPDFITVDGAEGGTGAAPVEFSDHVGLPWEEALLYVVDTLNGYDLKKDIQIFTATRIFTAFDIFKALCIGADLCNSARGMMLALGCIQALRCNTNECPTGIATNKPKLVRGLVVSEKWQRVRNYQQETLNDFLELFAAAGCTRLEELNRGHINKRVNGKNVSFAELYPAVVPGSYLQG